MEVVDESPFESVALSTIPSSTSGALIPSGGAEELPSRRTTPSSPPIRSSETTRPPPRGGDAGRPGHELDASPAGARTSSFRPAHVDLPRRTGGAPCRPSRHDASVLRGHLSAAPPTPGRRRSKAAAPTAPVRPGRAREEERRRGEVSERRSPRRSLSSLSREASAGAPPESAATTGRASRRGTVPVRGETRGRGRRGRTRRAKRTDGRGTRRTRTRTGGQRTTRKTARTTTTATTRTTTTRVHPGRRSVLSDDDAARRGPGLATSHATSTRSVARATRRKPLAVDDEYAVSPTSNGVTLRRLFAAGAGGLIVLALWSGYSRWQEQRLQPQADPSEVSHPTLSLPSDIPSPPTTQEGVNTMAAALRHPSASTPTDAPRLPPVELAEDPTPSAATDRAPPRPTHRDPAPAAGGGSRRARRGWRLLTQRPSASSSATASAAVDLARRAVEQAHQRKRG